MTMRLLLLAGLVATLLGAGPALAAQPNPLQGAFLQAPDGRVWVIVGGTRYLIQTTPATAEMLALFPEGSPVASRDELCALGAGAAVEPAAPAAAPAQPAAPADSVAALVGRSFKACKDGHPFAIRVVEASAAKTLNRSTATGRWLSVVVEAVNQGRGNESLYRALRLRDERGRHWGDVTGTASASAVDYKGQAVQAGAQESHLMIRPNVPTRVLLIFDVAEDATGLELYSVDTGC